MNTVVTEDIIFCFVHSVAQLFGDDWFREEVLNRIGSVHNVFLHAGTWSVCIYM